MILFLSQSSINSVTPPLSSPSPVFPPSAQVLNHKKSPKWLIILIIVFLLVSTSIFAYRYYQTQQVNQPVTPTAASSPAPTTTPDLTVDWITVTDTDNGYTFKIPQGWESHSGLMDTDRFVRRLENWPVIIDGQEKLIQTSMIIEKCFPPGCNVDTITNPSDRAVLPIKTESTIIDGFPAKKEIFFSENSPWLSKQSFRLVIEKGQGVYLITWQDFSEIFDQILSSFKFTDKNTPTVQDKKIGYIHSINQDNSNYVLMVDYIDFQTDQNYPNNYKIENTSAPTESLLIDLTNHNSPEIIMQTYSHNPDGSYNFNQKITFSEFLTLFNSTPNFQDIPYWFETINGQVIKITEQYLP